MLSSKRNSIVLRRISGFFSNPLKLNNLQFYVYRYVNANLEIISMLFVKPTGTEDYRRENVVVSPS